MYVFCEDGIEVRDSEFYSELPVHRGIITHSPCGPVTVSGCTYEGPNIGETGISINATAGVLIENCDFRCSGAMTFSGSTGTVTNCTTTSEMSQAVWVTSGSQVDLTDNQLHGNYAAIYVDSGSRATGSGNIFTGGTDLAAVYVSTASELQLTGNHILKDGSLAVMARWFLDTQYTRQNLTNNYWGTTDTDSIDAWIQDQNDDPTIHSVVDYLPIAETPLPADRSSLGGVKALFR